MRQRLHARGITVAEETLVRALATLNAGKHLAVVADYEDLERGIAFAQAMADGAAAMNLCVAWISMHSSAAALVSRRDLVRRRFVDSIWTVAANPPAEVLPRLIADVQETVSETARIIVVSTATAFRAASLSPAARRTLVRVEL